MADQLYAGQEEEEPGGGGRGEEGRGVFSYEALHTVPMQCVSLTFPLRARQGGGAGGGGVGGRGGNIRIIP